MSLDRTGAILHKKDFDPIFADEFFVKVKNTEEKEIVLPFPLPTEQDLFDLQFLISPRGENFKKNVKNIIDNIINIIKEWPIPLREKIAWQTKLTAFFTEQFNAAVSLQKMQSLYTQGVAALHKISHKIEDKDLPFSLRYNTIYNLLHHDELQRCSEAIPSFLNTAYMQLITNVKEVLMAARYQITLQVANETHKMLEANHPIPQRGMEMHYAHFYLFAYKDVLGVCELFDKYFPTLCPYKTKALFVQMSHILPAALTLDKIILEIMKKIDLAEIAANLKLILENALANKETNLTDIFFLAYKKQTEKLKDTLDNYGLDEDWVVGTLFNLENAPIHIRLDSEANKILAITLMNRLFNSGYLNSKYKLQVVLNADVNLFVLLGKHNIFLSYVKNAAHGGKYKTFDNYLSTLTIQQQRAIIVTLVETFAAKDKDILIELAAHFDHTGVFYLVLLEKNIITKEYKDNYDIPLLELAAKKGFLDVIVYCATDATTLINLCDNEGYKLIHIAAKNGQIEIIHYLLQHGSSIEDKTLQGFTPLLCALNAHVTVLQYLIDNGAIINVRDNNGYTPLQIALKKAFFAHADILLCAGAQIYHKDENINKTQKNKLLTLQALPQVSGTKEKTNRIKYLHSLRKKIITAYNDNNIQVQVMLENEVKKFSKADDFFKKIEQNILNDFAMAKDERVLHTIQAINNCIEGAYHSFFVKQDVASIMLNVIKNITPLIHLLPPFKQNSNKHFYFIKPKTYQEKFALLTKEIEKKYSIDSGIKFTFS